MMCFWGIDYPHSVTVFIYSISQVGAFSALIFLQQRQQENWL